MDFKLLKAINELVSNLEERNIEMRLQNYSKHGCECAVFAAKTTLTVSPMVTVLFLESGLIIETSLKDDFSPLTGSYSKDYLFFKDFSRRSFTAEEFITANHDFWIASGRKGLDLF